MTEQQWLEVPHPKGLLNFLRTVGLLPERKLRLFAAGVSHRVWALLTDDLFRRAIEEAERLAGESADAAQWRAILGEVDDDYGGIDSVLEVVYVLTKPPSAFDYRKAANISSQVAYYRGRAAFPDEDFDLGASSVRESEAETHAALVRCVFGNPFRPTPLDPAWLTPDVLALARAAYDERLLPSGELDPVRLAVLSDALEEAGCAEAILDHLRSPTPHTRGCWPLDLCLGLR